MELMAVCPVFETVHDVLAGDGYVVGVTLLHVSESAAGVGVIGLATNKSIEYEAPLPEFGVAVSVPVKCPTDVAWTVTVPQVAFAPQAPVGPDTLVPPIAE